MTLEQQRDHLEAALDRARVAMREADARARAARRHVRDVLLELEKMQRRLNLVLDEEPLDTETLELVRSWTT